MKSQPWVSESRRNLICVDSYNGGVLRGRLFHSGREMEAFGSLSQFLVKMEELLEQTQQPQSYTLPRAFSGILRPGGEMTATNPSRKGGKATFELRVLFRQHTSWQGVLCWKEQNIEHSFRSVLELVLLMDSALRSVEGSGMS